MTAPVPAATDDQPLESQDTPQPEGAETAAPVVAEAPVPSLPDRADAPVSEVAERFLRAVVAEVPLELIEELHLFSPLRQGTVETGIAVLAARVPVLEPAEEAGEPELPFEAGTAEEPAAEAPTAEAPTAEAPTAEAPTAETDDADADADNDADADAPAHEVIAIVAEDEGSSVVAAEGDDDEDVSVHDAEIVEASADESDEADAVSEEVAEAAAPAAAPAPRPVRHTVYTARYRYVIKGPERGKWESSIKAEADAPLITVETVVRGVQRRAGEDSEIVRYSGSQIAKALRVPYSA